MNSQICVIQKPNILNITFHQLRVVTLFKAKSAKNLLSNILYSTFTLLVFDIWNLA